MPDHLVHLVCGSTGAGKTTYARTLADRLGGVRFSIDEWMTALFWRDSSDPIDPAWAMERVERCYAQIWQTSLQVAGRGTPCVLDLGFSTTDSRKRFATLARDARLLPRLHFLDVAADERWRRVALRNADCGEGAQLRFAVTREMFEYVEGLWQPPTDEEIAGCDGVRVAADG